MQTPEHCLRLRLRSIVALQAVTAPLQLFCQVRNAATALSEAAGVIASNAIPAPFGESPCKSLSLMLTLMKEEKSRRLGIIRSSFVYIDIPRSLL